MATRRFQVPRTSALSGVPAPRMVPLPLPAKQNDPAQPWNLRLLQKLPPGGRGLAIGFGLAPESDTFLRTALDCWGIVLTYEVPRTFNLPAIVGSARLAATDAETPLLLVGAGDGVQTVFRILASNLTRTLVGVAVSGGEYPPATLPTWRRQGVLMRDHRGPRLLVDRAPEVLTAALGALPGLPEVPRAPEREAPAAYFPRLLGAMFGSRSPAMLPPIAPLEIE